MKLNRKIFLCVHASGKTCLTEYYVSMVQFCVRNIFLISFFWNNKYEDNLWDNFEHHNGLFTCHFLIHQRKWNNYENDRQYLRNFPILLPIINTVQRKTIT